MTQPPPAAPVAPSVVPPAAPTGPKTSGLAIAGLVCGIAGLCTFGLGGIVGLIVSIVALKRIRRSAGEVAGRGLAVAGLVVSIVTLLVGLLIVGGAVAFGLLARDKAQAIGFLNNAHILAQCAAMHAAMSDGQYPPPDTWPQIFLDEKYINNEWVLADPSDPGAGRAFAMNRMLGGRSEPTVGDAARTVLLFECAAGAPPAGDLRNLPDRPRHGSGYVVAFCDGHVEVVPPERVDNLIWDPAAQ
jgi:prepilin-type processing-associated H-X9-DG protein